MTLSIYTVKYNNQPNTSKWHTLCQFCDDCFDERHLCTTQVLSNTIPIRLHDTKKRNEENESIKERNSYVHYNVNYDCLLSENILSRVQCLQLAAVSRTVVCIVCTAVFGNEESHTRSFSCFDNADSSRCSNTFVENYLKLNQVTQVRDT